MLGLLFLLIVLKRDIVQKRALVRNDLNALVGRAELWMHYKTERNGKALLVSPVSLFFAIQECGIPKHFGLFYAMGTALMMEGLLSACYHVCPNYTNFQFGNCASFLKETSIILNYQFNFSKLGRSSSG